MVPDHVADDPDAGGSPPFHAASVPRARMDGWTPERQRRFIEILGDTGSVSRAAMCVGMSRESAYRLRRRKGAEAFAEAWDVARTAAVRVLADVALDRAIHGVEQPVFHKGEQVGTRTVMSDGLAMFLLRTMDPGTFGKAALNPDLPLPDLVGRGARQLRRRIHALFGPRAARPQADDDPEAPPAKGARS